MNIESLVERVKKLEKKINSNPKAPNEDYLTEKDVCSWLGVTIESVKRYEKEGKLIAVFPNAAKKYNKKDVILFMQGYMPSKV